jgi:hypothetical protein
MWKPLSIVSGVALLAGGGIIYGMVRPVLVAERLQVTNAEDYKQKADKLKLDAEAAIKLAEKELEKMKDNLSKAERAKAEAAAKKEEVAKAVEEAGTLKATAAKDLADLKQKMDDLGGLDVMLAEMKAQEAKLAESNRLIGVAKAEIESALSRKASMDKVIADIKRIDLWQQTGTMAPTFRSRITAVNPDWGFVTIGAGNASSVVRQAKLDVVRGNSVVGKVVVTHISPNSASAEIVPGSVAPGDSILPGDQVKTGAASLPSNIRSAPAPAAAKPADAPATPKDAAPMDPFASPPADTPAAAAETPATPPVEPAPAQ